MNGLLSHNDISKTIRESVIGNIPSGVNPPKNPQNADYQYKILVSKIKAFEESLDHEHEVAMQFASFGNPTVINVERISYCNPSIIMFNGTIDGNKATLIQHISQLNFLLLAVRKSEPELPPRRIGFDIQ